MPRLAADWKTILGRAWSVRLMVVAMILSGVEVALPMLSDGRQIFAVASGAATAAALAARFVAQRGMDARG